MSVGTWLKKEEADIAYFVDNLGGDLKTVVLPVAIEVTNIAKTLETVDSMDLIGTLVAGKAGAAIEDKVRAALTTIVPDLQLAQTLLSSGNVNTVLQGVLKIVAGATANVKTTFWIEFSGKLAQALDSGSLTIAQAIALAQWFYTNYPTAAATTTTTPTTPAT
jgi:hypothetical protein